LGASLYKGDIPNAMRDIAASGYGGEKIVIINPTDFATIAPFGDVTYDLFRKLGLNVEIAETDWGTVVQRRTNRESVEKGG
jgi:peptide/nickel transport system substrate-binding protein